MAHHRLAGQSTLPAVAIPPNLSRNVRRFRADAPPAALLFIGALLTAFIFGVVHVTVTGDWAASWLTLTLTAAATGMMIYIEVLTQRHRRLSHRLLKVLETKPVGAPVLARVDCQQGGHQLAYENGRWVVAAPVKA